MRATPVRSMLSILVLSCACLQAVAQETQSPPATAASSDLPRVELLTLLKGVTGSPAKRFLLDPRVPSHVVVGPGDTRSVSYPVLLTVLSNAGLVAVVSDDTISIVPDADVRQHPLPIVTSVEADRPDNEWVTHILRTQHVTAPQLVPILRPLLPQAAHLAAFPEQNALIIVDRYANVQRIVSIVRALDKPVEKRIEKKE
jgi:general secretion pathway protein D